jgi:hypothetical protein
VSSARRKGAAAARGLVPAAGIMPDPADVDRAESSALRELDALAAEMGKLTALEAEAGPGVSGEVATAMCAARGQAAVVRERLDRARRDRRRLDTARQLPAGGPYRAVSDVDGYALCPDPLAASTPAELMAALRRYRIWAGEPSYRQMARRSQAGKPGASTLNTALRSDRLPTLSLVLAVINGCGGSAEDLRRFATAWRRLRLAGEAGHAAGRRLAALPGPLLM